MEDTTEITHEVTNVLHGEPDISQGLELFQIFFSCVLLAFMVSTTKDTLQTPAKTETNVCGYIEDEPL